MKALTRFLLGILLLSPVQSCSSKAGEGSPPWKTLSQAVEGGATSGKIILVDVYTDWCGWCKRMDRDVYADASVGAYLEQNFVIAKLNAESSTSHAFNGRNATEREIAKAWGVTGYPATVFLTSKAEPITVVPGYIPRETFIKVLEYIHTESYKTTSWEDYLSSRSG
jgi:thioredoxin-related protein